MPENQATVLVLDDSEICLELAKEALEEGGFNVVTTSSALGFNRMVAKLEPDILVVDVGMPALSGEKLVEIVIRTQRHKCPILLHSDRSEQELRTLVKES